MGSYNKMLLTGVLNILKMVLAALLQNLAMCMCVCMCPSAFYLVYYGIIYLFPQGSACGFLNYIKLQ